MHKFSVCVLLVLVCIYSCKRLPNIQGPGEAVLQGVWQQDSLKDAEKLLNATFYHVKFSCDSFYLTMDVHAKVNYQNTDSCFTKNGWKEYAKGTYRVSNDTLILGGTYTKPNFKQKISGCFNIGNYLQKFLLKQIEKEKITLENLGSNQKFELKLKENIVCKQQEL